jgi:hypothetical protein
MDMGTGRNRARHGKRAGELCQGQALSKRAELQDNSLRLANKQVKSSI